jgi:hypothetical protein
LPQEKPQTQPPRIPELELSVAIRIFKDRYSVFIEPVEGKPYYVRFRQLERPGEPKRTIQGMTHNKGTMLNPRFLLQICERFEIAIPDFVEALAATKRGPQAVKANGHGIESR